MLVASTGFLVLSTFVVESVSQRSLTPTTHTKCLQPQAFWWSGLIFDLLFTCAWVISYEMFSRLFEVLELSAWLDTYLDWVRGNAVPCYRNRVLVLAFRDSRHRLLQNFLDKLL